MTLPKIDLTGEVTKAETFRKEKHQSLVHAMSLLSKNEVIKPHQAEIEIQNQERSETLFEQNGKYPIYKLGLELIHWRGFWLRL